MDITMIIQTRSAWLLIYTAVHNEFERTLTPAQMKAFNDFCARKFPQGYEMSTETMGEIQTAVDLMTEFCKMNGVVEWK